MADKNTTTNEKDWTIMIYMAGDNNLSEFMAESLYKIRTSIQQANRTSIPKVNVLVYYDSCVRNIPPRYFDLTNNQNILVTKSKVYQKYLNMNGRSDSESSESSDSIVNFVKWCVEEQESSANNYALFLSGHSNGFDESILLKDNDSKEVLTISGLKSALLQINFTINKDRDEKGTKPLDILGFDSCLMSMLEVGYEFRGLASYIIASEGETPISGWDYASILGSIDFGKKDARALSQDIVDRYFHSQVPFLIGGRSVNLTAWSVSESKNVLDKFIELIKVLNQLVEESGEMHFQILKSILNAHWNCQTHWLDQAIDIQDFCQILFNDIDILYLQFKQLYEPFQSLNLPSTPKIISDFLNILGKIIKISEDIRIKCNETIFAVYECVEANARLGADYQFSNGISLFFPWSLKSYRTMKNTYKSLEFSNSESGSLWLEFLENYLSNLTIRKQHGAFESDNDLNDDSSNNDLEDSIPEKRGKITDPTRGKVTDPTRGTIESFREFKNLDPDNWDLNQLIMKVHREKPKELKFSDNFLQWQKKQSNLY